MLFTYGNVEPLTGKKWHPLELVSERSAEVYLRRIIRAVPGIFRAEPAEFYVPLKNRDLDEFELLEGPFIYARSSYFIGLVRLKKVWGVVGLSTKGDSRLLKDALTVDDDYVQRLQEAEKATAAKRNEGLKVGAGVRILDGNYRDFCGTFLGYAGGLVGKDGQAVWGQESIVVMINLGFRQIELTTYWNNIRVITADGSDACWVPGFLGEREEGQMPIETDGV